MLSSRRDRPHRVMCLIRSLPQLDGIIARNVKGQKSFLGEPPVKPNHGQGSRRRLAAPLFPANLAHLLIDFLALTVAGAALDPLSDKIMMLSLTGAEG